MGRMGKKKLAVVYITHRKLNKDELLLFKYSIKNLRPYDKYLVISEDISLSNQFKDFKLIKKRKHFFTHINGYNQLLMLPSFYNDFIDYKNILILQPDCVILKKGIDRFCDIYPFIGSSFLKPKYVNKLWTSKVPRLGHLLSYLKYGLKIYGFNGGLSIRNVQFFKKNAPKLITNSNRLLYREDIIYSYLTLLKIQSFDINVADKFCLEEKLEFYDELKSIKSFAIHDPKKYNLKIYNEILSLSKNF